MADLAGDEVFFIFFSIVVCTWGARSYFSPMAYGCPLSRPPGRWVLGVVPLLCLCLTYTVLQTWSDPQVQDHLEYICLFLIGECAWFSVAVLMMPTIGLSVRDDAIERSNPAAVAAAGGLLASVGIVYAASNIGGGPTVWTTLYPAAAASIFLLLVWMATALIGGSVIEAITIDRDMASGLRLAGVLLGSSLILGRAVGGNWVSWDQTWNDFLHLAWTTLILAAAGGVVHRLYRPTPQQPRRPVMAYGIAPALAFVVAGLVVVALTPNAWHPSRW